MIEKKVNSRPVFDPVYGAIYLNDLEQALISSQPLQRLRKIQQLGLVDTVYPGANHTRFEHSLGTMYMSGRIAEHLDLPQCDIERARLAGLLHDVGHPAFSHAVESLLGRNSELQPSIDGRPAARHEEFTRWIISTHPFGPEVERIVEEVYGEIGPFFQDLSKVALGEVRPLGRVICGDIDADRIDFLLRDSHHCGVSLGLIDADQIVLALSLNGGEIVLSGSDDYRLDMSITAAESMLIARAHHYNALVHNPRVQSARSMLLFCLEAVLSSMEIDRAKEAVFSFFTRCGDRDLIGFMERSGDDWIREMLQRIFTGREYPLSARFNHSTLPPMMRMSLSSISRNGRMRKLFEDALRRRYGALVDISVGSGVPRSIRTSDGFLYDKSSLAGGLIKSLTRQITLSFFKDNPVEVSLDQACSLASKLLNFIRTESYLPIEGVLLLFSSLHGLLSQRYGDRVLVPRIRNITWLYSTVAGLRGLGSSCHGLEGLYDYTFHEEHGFLYSERLFEDIQILVATGMVFQDQREYMRAGRWRWRYEYMLTGQGLTYASDIASSYREESSFLEKYLAREKHTIPYDLVSLRGKEYFASRSREGAGKEEPSYIAG